MSPKTRQTIVVAAVVVGVAAIAGIAAIEGWIAIRMPGEPPAAPVAPGLRVAGTAPPESLSPGESVVEEARREAPKPPAPPETAKPAESAPEPKAEPPRKPAPKTPVYAPAAPRPPGYAQASPPKRATEKPVPRCANCGIIASTTFHEADPYAPPWEVRVTFDDGRRRVMRFPTDPGFRVGDRVFFSNGRLHRG